MLSNLCRGSPLPEYEKVELAVQFIASFLETMTLPQATIECLSALSYQIVQKNNNLDLIVESGASKSIISRVCEGSLSEHGMVLSMKILGNVSVGNNDLINKLLQ